MPKELSSSKGRLISIFVIRHHRDTQTPTAPRMSSLLREAATGMVKVITLGLGQVGVHWLNLWLSNH
ncbi:hypothetical protein [Streptomyces sp. 8L]|uniref:hypothetical protein n=1 Tax=Streptomyces sp. 8L TaxID=2877242 RepID=UPI001CD648FE|nr:hypothetical protein [Streptomyces sp. 8L]MCA1220369.1 hypothetical protein [Streptomyces sp. 8L]